MDIVTIGDGMITFDPSTKGPLRFVQTFERKIGGAELNVMLGCARLGLNSGWISRLGKDEFGRHIFNEVRGEGVDVSEVKLMPGYATSLNFKEIQETGDGRTFYYRLPSPTETLTPETLPFEYISNAKIIHLTGVFCAILEQNRAITMRALEWAKENGVVVSFDPNIRLRLWTAEEARDTLLTYLPYVDHLLTSREELELLFETKDENELINKLASYQFESVVMKDGAEGAFALIEGSWKHVPGVHVAKVVDTVGAGDGFDSGYLYGLLKGWPIEERLTFANAIGAMVVQVHGDNEGLPYLEEVEQFLGKREIIVR